jgi:IS30 family transposase
VVDLTRIGRLDHNRLLQGSLILTILQVGVVMPGKRLTCEQRATMERCWAAGWPQAQIAVAVGVHASTVSREVARNGITRNYGARHPRRRGPGGRLQTAYRLRYSAREAQRQASRRAKRPRQGKLAGPGFLQDFVLDGLRQHWSPQQIAGRLRHDYPDTPERWVSAEAIYLAIYLQPRGGLKDLLAGQALRTARVNRRPQRPSHTRAPFADLPTLAQRPAEADDRAVPGHHEGDLVIGTAARSGIATIVERATRYTTLVALPNKAFHNPKAVADAVAAKLLDLPTDLRRSLTWDRGLEMVHSHARFTVAADCKVYFADPHAPWQRATNENTNGLLRQYFPKGAFDFNTITQADLDAVADELNRRPRRVLGYRTPAEVFNDHLRLATTG